MEGKKAIDKVKCLIDSNAQELHAQIEVIQETVIDTDQISDPFFELESIYYDYYKGLAPSWLYS